MATTFTVQQHRFKDLDLDATLHPVTRDLITRKDIPSVLQSVRNLILTIPGERPMQPQLGTRLNDLLFENWTPDVKSLAHAEINYVLKRYEPRVKLIDVQLDDSHMDINHLGVKVIFNVIGFPQTYEVSTILTRSR